MSLKYFTTCRCQPPALSPNTERLHVSKFVVCSPHATYLPHPNLAFLVMKSISSHQRVISSLSLYILFFNGPVCLFYLYFASNSHIKLYLLLILFPTLSLTPQKSLFYVFVHFHGHLTYCIFCIMKQSSNYNIRI